jgi:hypothetical protein
VLIIASSWGSQLGAYYAPSPATPFKCCFLDAFCTPLASSQYYSSIEEQFPCAMDPSASCATAGSSGAEKKRRGHPLGNRNKPKVPGVGAPGARGPLRIGTLARGVENHTALGTSGPLTLQGPAPGGALAALLYGEH